MRYLSILLFNIIFFSLYGQALIHNNFPANPVVPSLIQYNYQQMEMVGFIHFTMNTFTNKEWGEGDESPAIFNPVNLDAEQWVKVAKDAGIKELILTAKHHDGFCLWPSIYTEHSVKNSPYKNGKGDIVKEFTDACRKHGLKAGLYLSPWDRNHADYGRPEYITYYRNQLRELLTNYGKISEVWFDGANGGMGYYGGAREVRTIDKTSYYGWDTINMLVKELQPDALVFSDAGPGTRWIGNENGIAGETCWSTIDRSKVIIGAADMAYLNTGDPDGKDWVIGQCDVSIRPGWFYHEKEDTLVKTPEYLVDLYYKSVGRNAVLLLNLPPGKDGLIHNNDIASLREFRRILDETFKTNLASGSVYYITENPDQKNIFPAKLLTDDDLNTFWAGPDGSKTASLIIETPLPVQFDRIMLQEPIAFGQRISKFSVEAEVQGKWKEIASATTIGYKRLLKVGPLTASKIRITILEANNTAALAGFGLFKASDDE